jgi:surface protein
MVYTLTCQSSDTNTCLGKEETPLPKVVGSALTQPSIAPGTTHTYTLSVTFKDTDSEQDYNQNKRVSFKITINEQQELGTLIARPDYDSTELFWEHSANITEVTFEDTINIPNGVTSWDASATQDSSVMTYIIDDGLGTNTYHLYIQSNGILFANSNSSNLFRDFTKLITINNLEMFTTSNVTNMESMFVGCSSLTSLDLSNFNTINVTNMSGMFWGCSALTSLDLSTFDTSSVTSMARMFNGCSSLTSLDVSTFDTGSVRDMFGMFCNCSALTSIDVSTFDTSSVTNMYVMFFGCTSLTSLHLSTFDTSSVTNIYGMFQGCSSLTSLDLSTFDTSSVTDMSIMFYGCSSLTSLDFRLADFSSVTSYSMMFVNITNGINIVVKDATAQTWITSRLTDAGKTGTVVIA